jgi:hypothetical protein
LAFFGSTADASSSSIYRRLFDLTVPFGSLRPVKGRRSASSSVSQLTSKRFASVTLGLLVGPIFVDTLSAHLMPLLFTPP